jgi:predicted acylesterase/phospholipase RssA
MSSSPFESVVMAGGGSRCLWHVGFWREAAEPLRLAPRQIATVSAGGALSSAIFSGKGDEALRYFVDVTSRNPRNIYLRNVVGPEKVFPHEKMYRRALLDILDMAALQRLHAGPDIRILLGHAPRWLGPRGGLVLAALAYNYDKHVRKLVHPEAPTRVGFRPEVVSVRDCATPEQLTDLILASSCTPPMTALQRWNGRYVLDGGVVDNVPCCALQGEPGETLVLLTRRYPKLPEIARRTYVQPSEKLPISAWDYANPKGLQATYDLGRRDGEAFAQSRRRRLAATG